MALERVSCDLCPGSSCQTSVVEFANMTELTADQEVDLCLGDVMQDVVADSVSAAEVRPYMCLQPNVTTPSFNTVLLLRLLPLGQSQIPALVWVQSTKDSTAYKKQTSLLRSAQIGLSLPSNHPSRKSMHLNNL